ncbi:MAG: rubrerythrin family protein [Candidatus Hydrothermarchaeales archaeon]
MGNTENNLKEAFAGESQANRRYTAFAKKADAEGFPNVARLFRAAAASETHHALKHLNVLGEVKSTAENLKAAVEGETFEHSDMYPKFIATAEEEGKTPAKISFFAANEAEKVHAELYSKAIEAVESGSDIEAKDYYVCQVCGFTVEGEAPDTCPVCRNPKEVFKRID